MYGQTVSLLPKSLEQEKEDVKCNVDKRDRQSERGENGLCGGGSGY